MKPRWLWLVLLLHILFSSVQLCEIPGGNLHHINTLNADLLKLTQDDSTEPNPSIYLALRLSDDHNLETERYYLERLKNVYQPNASSSLVAATYQEQPGTGHLALYLLALRVACYNMETVEANRLVTQLKLHLHKEKEKIGPEGHGWPITNYYQYSLGVLAMCVHGKMIDQHVIRKLLHAEEDGRFRGKNKLSVDTEAMAGLAFACLQQATIYTPDLMAKLNRSVEKVKKKILQAQTPEGAFGNIYSSPLAVQFLLATGMSQKKPECPKGMAALLQHLEHQDFQNILFKSQLLPVLYGKSYLDIASMECHTERNGLVISTPSPTLAGTTRRRKRIAVQLIVKHPPHSLPLYRRVLSVPQGSSLLDVLKEAAKQALSPLLFETQDTFSGPLLTAMMGVKPQEGERKYWEILRTPSTILEQGIADYIPQDKETIIFKFSPW
ncbi:transcobalamin-2 [Sceloporus undulatus]|uniref:transcobalamin-2 n=1 Tax=Sceloporus undulatus TaxID=8520 RepID=UPI001C4B8266|nr:transcobalamin-2 [Sceloporus undulatus]XP_042297737.1 transcobalamin-2 [Sceloporus undulatus]